MKKAKAKALFPSAYSEGNSAHEIFQDMLAKIIAFDFQKHETDLRSCIDGLKSVADGDQVRLASIYSEIDKLTVITKSVVSEIVKLEQRFPKELDALDSSYKEWLSSISERGNILDKIASSIPKPSNVDTDTKWHVTLEKWLTNAHTHAQAQKAHETEEVTTPTTINTLSSLDINAIALPKYSYQDQSQGECKTLQDLLTEMVSTNTPDLLEARQRIAKYYVQWRDKAVSDIYSWATAKKHHSSKTSWNSDSVHEAIAIMDRANELATGGHRLRDTQILSVLEFLNKQEGRGKLCQIQTGEGKTTIVSLLVTLKVLQGEKVDIITSNDVLAEEGVRSKLNFYSLFGISVATNNNEHSTRTKQTEGARACYTADVVYGSIGNFQFDYLKDSFLGQNTRAGRQFGTVILDEVDSMLVDNGSHIAKLASPFPGMESLRYIYIKIWQEINKAEEVLGTREISPETKAIINAIIHTKDILSSAIMALIPEYLREYARSHLDKWIQNAIYAKYDCHENKQYIITSKDGERVITPVDYVNTGVGLSNTVWPQGLHQFLQLKHNLQLTVETLTNSHISNMHYIKKYGEKIFGMTGTLGSDAETNLLSEIYSVDLTIIPTYKVKRFTEDDGRIVKDEEWLDSIVLNVLKQTENDRAVLVICETIEDAKTIKKHLELFQSLYKDAIHQIRVYLDQDGSSITEEKVGIKDVVVATNIAGRGTDLSTTETLNNNGGLHVCVSFLPCNKRVEDQAFGRTSRQGNHGSAELVIKESEVRALGMDGSLEMLNVTSVKHRRDEVESERIKSLSAKVMKLNLHDELFCNFSKLYQELKAQNCSTEGFDFVLEDLKELWAFWIEQQNFRDASETASQVFERFMSDRKTTTIIIDKKIAHNPYHLVKQSEYFLERKTLFSSNTKLALAKCAMEQEGVKHIPGGSIILFEVAIEQGGYFFRKLVSVLKALKVLNVEGPELISEPSHNYKVEALSHLEDAKGTLDVEISYLRQFFSAGNKLGNILLPNSSECSNKNIREASVLKASLRYIDGAEECALQSITLFEAIGINNLKHILFSIAIDDLSENLICIAYLQSHQDTVSAMKIFLSKDQRGNINILCFDPQKIKDTYVIKWLLTKYCASLPGNTASDSKETTNDLESSREGEIVDLQTYLHNNFFYKHLCAKLLCLMHQQKNIYELASSIRSSHASSDLILSHKSYNDTKKITLNQDVITTSDIEELYRLGLCKAYKVSALSPDAQIKDTGLKFGLKLRDEHAWSCTKAKECFAYILHTIRQSAFLLIAEGICDIISTLMGQECKQTSEFLEFQGKVATKSKALFDRDIGIQHFVRQILEYATYSYKEHVFVQEYSLDALSQLCGQALESEDVM